MKRILIYQMGLGPLRRILVNVRDITNIYACVAQPFRGRNERCPTAAPRFLVLCIGSVTVRRIFANSCDVDAITIFRLYVCIVHLFLRRENEGSSRAAAPCLIFRLGRDFVVDLFYLFHVSQGEIGGAVTGRWWECQWLHPHVLLIFASILGSHYSNVQLSWFSLTFPVSPWKFLLISYGVSQHKSAHALPIDVSDEFGCCYRMTLLAA